MSREEIMQDMKFREACSKYGVSWENCEVYGEVIVLNTPIDNLYILMDKNYNTFCIDKKNPKFEAIEDLEDFAEKRFVTYCIYTDILSFIENFGYPFGKFTLKNIIDLSNRVEVTEANHGQSLRTRINGEWYDRDSKEEDDYFKLLSYAKFLGEEIKQYFLLSYHMQVMGYEMPNVYEYVRQLIEKVNERLDNCLGHYRRPYPKDILSYIGQNYREVNMNEVLYDIIDLLMSDKGYKINSKRPDLVIKITNLNETKDLSNLASDLLRILDMSDEELKQKDEEDRARSLQKQIDDFKPWLEEDIEE